MSVVSRLSRAHDLELFENSTLGPKRTALKVPSYEVERGRKFDYDSFMEQLHPLVFSAEEQHVIALGRKLAKDGTQNFGGAFFQNGFRVNHGILLNGVYFLGPAVADEGTYRIRVDVMEAKKPGRLAIIGSKRIAKMEQTERAKRGEPYLVEFRSPVRIQPFFWYTLEFCLDGPDTACCEITYTEASVNTPVGVLTFDFLEGSRQMPKLNFSLI